MQTISRVVYDLVLTYNSEVRWIAVYYSMTLFTSQKDEVEQFYLQLSFGAIRKECWTQYSLFKGSLGRTDYESQLKASSTLILAEKSPLQTGPRLI